MEVPVSCTSRCDTAHHAYNRANPDPSVAPAWPSRLELVRETQLGLRAAVVEAAEAPGVEDGRAAAPRRDEVPLCEVHDEVVAHHVIDRPEGLHAELVGRVNCHAEHGEDAAAAVEGEPGEGEERLPVAELVAVGRVPR